MVMEMVWEIQYLVFLEFYPDRRLKEDLYVTSFPTLRKWNTKPVEDSFKFWFGQYVQSFSNLTTLYTTHTSQTRRSEVRNMNSSVSCKLTLLKK